MQNLSISLKTGQLFDGYIRNNFLFTASGRGVNIYDITNPNNPLITHYIDTPNLCCDISIKGNLLYTVDGAFGLEVYDITQPQNPILLSSFSSENELKEIYVRDSIFATSTKPYGISIFKYGGNIIRLGRLPLNSEIKGLYMKDSLLVAGLSNNKGFAIYDISNPSNPFQVSPSYSNFPVNDIAGKDTILYLACGNNGLKVYNTKEPSSPDSIGGFPMSDYLLYLSLYDSLLFVTGISDSIYVFDVTNPSNPLFQNGFRTSTHSLHPATDGNIIYTGEHSMAELFSMPAYSKLCMLDSIHPVIDGFITCSLGYVASEGKGLITLDIKDPYNPLVISIFDSLTQIRSLYVRDTFAYLSCGERGLFIIDMADPYYPIIISSYDTPGTLYFILKRGNELFLADGGSGIEVISVEEINHPVLLDSINLPGNAYDIAIKDTIAFVSLGLKGFGVLNIKENENISIIDTITGIGFSRTLETDGTYLFVGTDESGVMIYDVTSPENPFLINTYPIPTPVNDIYYENNLLFLASDVSGITVLDVTDPYLPIYKDSLDTPGIATKIGPSRRGIIPVADYYSFRIDSSYKDTIPPSPVSHLTVEALDSLIILRWFNPDEQDYMGTRLLFRNDTFPSTPYSGTLLLNHEMEPSSSDSFYHIGLPGDSTHFYYALFAYDYADNFSEANLISSISASDTIPPQDVSVDTFNFWSDTIEVSFTTPSDPDFAGVRAMFDTTHIPQNINDGELFFDEGLPPNSSISRILGDITVNKTYYFTFFSKDSIPNFSTGISDSFRIYPDTIPPEEVSIDTFVSWCDTIEVRFTTPNDSDFIGVRAMYDLTDFPQNPNQGTLFFDDSLAPNSQISRILGGVLLDTTYYFTFFTRDTVPNFSTGISDSFCTYTDTVPPDTIMGFITTSFFPDTIKLLWFNPTDPDLESVMIRYSKNNYPIAPDSGKLLYNLTSNPGDTLHKIWINNYFSPGVRYYFSGFSFDRTGNVSVGSNAFCLTPRLTKVSETYPPEPVPAGLANWLDSVEISFTAPMQVTTLISGVEIEGRKDYSFRIERDSGNRYIFIPPSFSALDTVTVTLKETIRDSIGNPFDGNGNGIPDATDEYAWSFYTGLVCDYTEDGIITSEDFAVFKNAYDTQNIAKETGPCEGTAPYYELIPDSMIDFEDFAIFVMMWNWSVDNREIDEIEGDDPDSLLRFESKENNLVVKSKIIEGLAGGEIILEGFVDSVTVERGAGLEENDIFFVKSGHEKILISFGTLNEIKDEEIAKIALNSFNRKLDYSYRLTFLNESREGKGIISLENPIPKKTILSSIYPNPGNRINIVYGIPKDMELSINLYDVAGRKVLNLEEGEKRAGYHRIIWNGTNNKQRLPLGIYFIRLKTDKDTIVRTIILLK